jgi:hypothetical protein
MEEQENLQEKRYGNRCLVWGTDENFIVYRHKKVLRKNIRKRRTKRGITFRLFLFLFFFTSTD